MRTPEQIIGHDALTQLIFEGYKVVPDDTPGVGDHVAESQGGLWRGVVKSIRPISGGIGAPGIAVVDSGRGRPEEWNLTRLRKTTKPHFVYWLE